MDTHTGISTDVDTPLSAAIKRAEKAEAEVAALRKRVEELEAEVKVLHDATWHVYGGTWSTDEGIA